MAASDHSGSEEADYDVIADIVNRIAAEQVPPVLPSQQSAVSLDVAKDLASWALACDAVQFQSFLNEEYGKYRQDAPLETDKSQEQLRAAWMRDSYYVHLQKYKATGGSKEVVYEALQSLMDDDENSNAIKDRLRQTAHSLDIQQLDPFMEYVESSWACVWQSTPAIFRVDEERMKKHWFTSIFEELIHKFEWKEVGQFSEKKFLSELELSDIENEAVRQEAGILFQGISAEQAVEIQRQVNAMVEKREGEMPPALLVDIRQEFRRNIVRLEYLNIVRGVVNASPGSNTNFEFKPLVLPESLASNRSIVEAQALVSQVKERHAAVIELEVQSAYEVFLRDLPAASKVLLCGVEDKIKDNWMRQEYFGIVRRVVEQKHGGPCYLFSPLVPPEALETSEAVSRAKVLVSRVEEQHESRIAQAVNNGFAAFQSSMPVGVFKGVEEQMKQNWLRTEYFNIIASILQEDVASVKQSISSTSSPGKASTDMFMSPNKKARVTPSAGPEEVPQFRSVDQLFREEFLNTDLHILEGYVLFAPEEARWIDTQNKKSRTSELIPVLTLLVADRTGPVLVDLWRGAAEKMLKDQIVWKKDSEEPLLLEVNRFWIRGDRAKWKTPFVKVVSNDKTEIRVLARPTQNSVLDVSRPPSPTLFTKDFGVLSEMPPFRVSITGIVSCVQAAMVSQSGRPMQGFKLQDASGRYVSCMAFNRQVGNESLRDGNEVILYFASAMTGLSQNSGQMLIHDESHVLLIRAGCCIPPARTAVELR